MLKTSGRAGEDRAGSRAGHLAHLLQQAGSQLWEEPGVGVEVGGWGGISPGRQAAGSRQG